MHRPALLIALALLLTACTSTLPGTDAQMQDIDRFVAQTLRTLPEVPSIGIAIVRDGRTYARAYGHADLARRVPADANTGYYNGSNTKAYTAAVCAMLAQEGVLDLDAPVTKYVPELQWPAPIDGSKMTLRRFLSHTSGIENDAIVFRTAFSGEHTPAELVRILGMSAPRENDGFRYDNLGYVVASLAIERVTGKKWQDVLDEKLFEPLRMHRTTASMSEARRERVASPYILRSGQPAFLEFGWKRDSMMHAAGGIMTTPNDLAKFLAANLTPSVAFAETHKQQTPAKRDSFLFDATGYGFGWYQSDLHGEKLLYHGGGFEGWRSVYSFMPGRKIAVGAMTNLGLSHSPLELVSAYVYDRLLDVPDVDATYMQKLAEIRARWDTVKKNAQAEGEKQAQRSWTLQHPLQDYAGRYESPAYGTLAIELREGKLVASIGGLRAELEPFTEPESARVELIPGSGEPLLFTFTTRDVPDSLKWGDEIMVRK